MRSSGKGRSPARGSKEPSGDTLENDSSGRGEWNGFAGEDEIRVRAYELYVERGQTDGDELADWLRAERELQRRRDARSEETSREAGGP